jgi:hypothetical protein
MRRAYNPYRVPFSTLTTGIQKVELDDILAPWLHSCDDDDDAVHEEVWSTIQDIVSEDHDGWTKKDFTVFAPTNRAFKKLG